MTTVDWTQQMEEVTKQWTEVQTQLWSSWGEAAQKASSQAQAKAVWQQMIDQWKNLVHRMLEMQVETARLWSENVSDSDMFEGMTQWSTHSYQMTKQWSMMQKQLWDGWFQMLEKMDPTMMPDVKDLNNQPFMKLWNDMTQQATAMQQEWMNAWTAWQPGKKG